MFTGLVACESPNTKDQKDEEVVEISEEQTAIKANQDSDAELMEKNGLRLQPLSVATSFPDAELHLGEMKKVISKSGKQSFNFDLKNFELGVQTEDSRNELLASSAKGQHIHFILNNGPYRAEYQPSFEVDLVEGHNVFLAFPSRSYHESVKGSSAYVFDDIVIGEGYEPFDKSAPHLMYSRPKGTYSGAGAERILFDFYLLNTEISKEGKQVELTIDDSKFMIHSWQPYWVEGLDAGEHSFRIRLLDAEGKLVPGPFNDSGNRTITIE